MVWPHLVVQCRWLRGGQDALGGGGQVAPLLRAAVDVVRVGDLLEGSGLAVDVEREGGRSRVLDAASTTGQDGLVVRREQLDAQLGELGEGHAVPEAGDGEDVVDDVRVLHHLGEVEVDRLARHLAGAGLGVATVTERTVEGPLVLLVAGADPDLRGVRGHRQRVEVDTLEGVAARLHAPREDHAVVGVDDRKDSAAGTLGDDGAVLALAQVRCGHVNASAHRLLKLSDEQTVMSDNNI